MPALWDISPPVHAGSPVFPGDAPFERRWSWTLGPGCPVNVSTLQMSPHTGAHADAPLHYDPAGAAVGELPLEPFLGPCRVIHAVGCGPLIQPAHLAHALAGLPPRVLVRTYAQAPVDTRTATLVEAYLDWAESHARTGQAGRPAFLDEVDAHSRLERMEQALRACTLWLWLGLRFEGVYGHVDEVLALRSALNDGIERQLKGKRPLAERRMRRSGRPRS